MRRPGFRVRLSARRGFTIAEMLLSMTLMLALLGMSTQLFRKQSQAVSRQAGRLDAQQNSRFAIEELDRELRMEGAGVLDQQPMLVAATAMSISFNADLVSHDTGDLSAVYIDPDVDSTSIDGMGMNDKYTIPGTTFTYPETTYASQGVPTNAETITYWLSKDSTSTHSNEYIMFRRVNGAPAHVVARGLVVNPGDTVFQYYKTDTAGVLTAISPASLPLVHNAAIHGSMTDTGKFAVVDSIKQVKVTITSVYHQTQTNTDITRRMQSVIHLMNAGLVHHSMCGNPPLVPSNVSAVVTAANGTTIPATYVTVMWNPSTDDGAGEKDVQRYALYKRLSSQTAFDQPFASVPAGSATYSFNDFDFNSGDVWIYGVSAQDCTPNNSAIVSATSVTIP